MDTIQCVTSVIKIPNKALSFYEQKEGVWLLKDKKAIFKPIQILARGDKAVATNDIKETELIIIPNPKKKPLENNMKVFIKR